MNIFCFNNETLTFPYFFNSLEWRVSLTVAPNRRWWRKERRRRSKKKCEKLEIFFYYRKFFISQDVWKEPGCANTHARLMDNSINRSIQNLIRDIFTSIFMWLREFSEKTSQNFALSAITAAKNRKEEIAHSRMSKQSHIWKIIFAKKNQTKHTHVSFDLCNYPTVQFKESVGNFSSIHLGQNSWFNENRHAY